MPLGGQGGLRFVNLPPQPSTTVKRSAGAVGQAHPQSAAKQGRCGVSSGTEVLTTRPDCRGPGGREGARAALSRAGLPRRRCLALCEDLRCLRKAAVPSGRAPPGAGHRLPSPSRPAPSRPPPQPCPLAPRHPPNSPPPPAAIPPRGPLPEICVPQDCPLPVAWSPGSSGLCVGGTCAWQFPDQDRAAGTVSRGEA